ncbi:cutinase family protein [Nocardioides sp. LML1-1-1.1]|uniref:cutinase family protein n=1 Tax=Nocardioides sp. LML1-1-1.1 TaxID=3135248 RepID=UPI003424DB26
MTRSVRLLAVTLAALLAVALAPASPAHAGLTKASRACTSLVVVGLRGSGEAADSGSIRYFGQPASKAAKNMVSRIKRSGTYRYAGIPYDAKRVNPVTYGASVADGVKLLTGVLRSIKKSCGTGTKFALIGYSQGAQVVRESVAKLEQPVRAQIVAVGLIGDPKRRGYDQRPAEIGYNENFDRGTLAGSGKLGAGRTFEGLLKATKVASFCVKGDWICNDTVGTTWGQGWATDWHTGFYNWDSSARTIGFGLYTRLVNNGFR